MPSALHVWQFYLSPGAAWEAMYRDCAQAAQSIEVEQYILENDALGRKLLELFIEKAAQGVKVFVLCDGYGSAALAGSPLLEKLRASGGQFYFYHAISLLGRLWPWKWLPRTHIKTLLVDSTIAYTGGVCFAERMENWRDTQIRITGPVVAQIRTAFDNIEEALIRRKRVKAMRTPNSREAFIYLQSYPLLSWHIIYRELIQAMSQAERTMYLSTAFFAPNRRFRRLLRNACRRGVDVRLLIPEKSDVVIADWLCLSYAERLLKAGVRIFRYQNTVLHNKTVVIDDGWATIGSTNMDIISFFRNRESNLVIADTKAVADLKGHFLADLGQSEELTLNKLKEIPLWKRGVGYLARVIKAFL
jgi:cardiolipin synthase A/B